MCEIPNVSEYSLWKGRIRCCFHWALIHSYVPQKSSTSVLAESFSIFDDYGMKKLITHEFTKGEIYIDLVKNLFFIESDIDGLDDLFDILNQLRFFDSTENGVTQQSLFHEPINLECHVDFIEMLMMNWLKQENVNASAVVALQKLTLSNQSFDGSVKHLLKHWINEIVEKVKEMNDLIDNEEENIMDQQYPHVNSLEDLYDGKALALVLHYYCPSHMHFQDICLNEPISVADAWHNLQLVLDFYNNRLVPSSSTTPVCPTIKPSILQSEDILYYDEELKIPLIIFISNLFILLESKPGKLVLERDFDSSTTSTVTTKSDTKQLVDVSNMISNATKRSFLKQQSDQLSSSTKSTPDIFRSSLATNKPLLSRRHVAHNIENRPYTCEELSSYPRSETKIRPQTSSAIRSHPLRKSASLHDIDRSPVTPSDQLSSRARWRKKRQQISVFKKQLSRDSMGESQSTQSSSSPETVVVETKPTSSTTTLLSNVHIDSDDDSTGSSEDMSKTHRVKSPLLSSTYSASINDSTDQMLRNGPLVSSMTSTMTPQIIPDQYSPENKIRSPSKASSQSSYTITSGGFSTAESAIAAGVPVITSSHETARRSMSHASPQTSLPTNRVDVTKVVSSEATKNGFNDSGESYEEEEDYFSVSLKPKMNSWSQMRSQMKRNKTSARSQEGFSSRLMKRNKVETMMWLSEQLERKRTQINHDQEQVKEKMEKERAKVLLNIRRAMYMYGLQIKDLQDNENQTTTLRQSANSAWTDQMPTSARNKRLLVNTETQTSQGNLREMAKGKGSQTETSNGQQYFNSPHSQTYIYKPEEERNVQNKTWVKPQVTRPAPNVPYAVNRTNSTGNEHNVDDQHGSYTQPMTNGYGDGHNKLNQSLNNQNHASDYNHNNLQKQHHDDATKTSPASNVTYDIKVAHSPSNGIPAASIPDSFNDREPTAANRSPTINIIDDTSNQPTRRSLFASGANQLDNLDKHLEELKRKDSHTDSKWNEVTMSYDSFCQLNTATSNHSTPSKQLIDQMMADNNNTNNNTTGDDVVQQDTLDGDVVDSMLSVPEEVSKKGGKGFEIITEQSPINELNRKKEQFFLKQLKKEEDMKRKKVEREAENERKKEELRIQQEQAAAKKEEERLRRQQRLEEYKKRKEQQEEASQMMLKPGLISSSGKKVKQAPKSAKANRIPALTVPLTPSNNMTYTKQAASSSPSHDDLLLSSGDFISNKLKFSPTRMAKSHNHINEIGRDWDLHSNASGASLEYTGPKLYKQLSVKSNRHLMMNAVCHSCLPGKVNESKRQQVTYALESSDAQHIMVLFRDSKCQYRAIYSYDTETEQLHKISGAGPSHISYSMIDTLFKYNSGRKGFVKVPSKTLSVGIDGITIQDIWWKPKKSSSAVGSNGPLSARKKH